MLFTSLNYFIFLALTVGFTFSLPARARISFLAVASYFFYAYWKPGYALVILALTIINYGAALTIHVRGAWAAAIIANLSTFFVFKYLGFFTQELNLILRWLDDGGEIPVLTLLLPLGISFHTLQAISYVTDVKRGIFSAEKNFWRFALFIAWFPQMIAGPIERASTLLVQLKTIERPTSNQVKLAGHLVLIGLLKKILIADSLGVMIRPIYLDPGAFPPWQVWLAVYGFGLQLYFDFSAYMGIAMGSSLLFGVTLSENFKDPFLASSIPDFWRRWHISLTSWFFEYVYYPLVRKFPSGGGPYAAVILVFALSGLWHGANWTFIVWGLLHGALYCLSILLPPWRSESLFSAYARVAFTFSLVCLCWVMFRAPSVNEAMDVYLRLLGVGKASIDSLWPEHFEKLLAAMLGMLAVTFLRETKATSTPPWVYAILVWLILTLGNFDSDTFIYFQF